MPLSFLLEKRGDYSLNFSLAPARSISPKPRSQTALGIFPVIRIQRLGARQWKPQMVEKIEWPQGSGISVPEVSASRLNAEILH